VASFSEYCFSVSVAESPPAEGKSSYKETSTKCRKHAVESKTEMAGYAGSEVQKMQTYASSYNGEQTKCKRHTDVSMRHTPACKLFTLPRSGLYEYFFAKLKRRAYLAKMKKQLVKHEGKVQCGKDVMHIDRKHLAKLLKLLNKIDDADSLKNKKKQIARKLSRLLEDALGLQLY